MMANKKLDQEAFDKLIKNEFVFEEQEKSAEEIVEEDLRKEIERVPATKEVENNGDIDASAYNKIEFPARGLKSLGEAILFMDTPYFRGLGESEKIEYRNWLIKK